MAARMRAAGSLLDYIIIPGDFTTKMDMYVHA